VTTVLCRLRPSQSGICCVWPLAQLVNQVVPPPVQHAEGLNLSATAAPILTRLGVTREQGYVWPEGGRLSAYAGLSRGSGGAWVRILLHPDARQHSANLMHSLLAVAPAAPILYCAVREYQAGLRSTLVSMGFELAGMQVWLVKHTARPVECRPYRHLVALDKRTEPAPTPLHPASGATSGLSWVTSEHNVYEYTRTDSLAVGSN